MLVNQKTKDKVLQGTSGRLESILRWTSRLESISLGTSRLESRYVREPVDWTRCIPAYQVLTNFSVSARPIDPWDPFNRTAKTGKISIAQIGLKYI